MPRLLKDAFKNISMVLMLWTAGISVIICLSSRGMKKLVVEWGTKLELGPPWGLGRVMHV